MDKPSADDLAALAVRVFGGEMARALDGGYVHARAGSAMAVLFNCGGYQIATAPTPRAVITKIAEINGRPRRLTVTVELTNAEATHG